MFKRKYDIWLEGYCITGNSAQAQRVATNIEARSFEDAVIKFARSPDSEGYGNFDPNSLSFWGCRAYPTRGQAERSFG